MIKPIVTATISTLLLVTAVYADEPAKKPSAEQKKLEVLIGKWKYDETGSDSPFGKASHTIFRAEVKPVKNGFFLEESGKAEGSSYTYSILYFYDSEAGTYKTFYNDSDGLANLATATFDGKVFVSAHTRTFNGKTYQFRDMMTLGADGKSLSYTSEYEDGGQWKINFQGTGKKR